MSLPTCSRPVSCVHVRLRLHLLNSPAPTHIPWSLPPGPLEITVSHKQVSHIPNLHFSATLPPHVFQQKPSSPWGRLLLLPQASRGSSRTTAQRQGRCLSWPSPRFLSRSSSPLCSPPTTQSSQIWTAAPPAYRPLHTTGTTPSSHCHSVSSPLGTLSV